jgi:hypothetical protein
VLQHREEHGRLADDGLDRAIAAHALNFTRLSLNKPEVGLFRHYRSREIDNFCLHVIDLRPASPMARILQNLWRPDH